MGNNVIKGDITYNDQKLLIRGPRMTLGSSINKNGDNYYIDLTFNDRSNNQKFMKYVNDIDCLVMIDISENTKSWYGDADVSLTQIEQEFISTVKKSSIHDRRFSLKLKVHHDKIEFYDQDSIVVPYQLIKENFNVVPLLHLSAIYKDSEHIWLEWGVPQLKIELPDNILSGCQLVDIDDSDIEDEAIPDNEFENI